MDDGWTFGRADSRVVRRRLSAQVTWCESRGRGGGDLKGGSQRLRQPRIIRGVVSHVVCAGRVGWPAVLGNRFVLPAYGLGPARIGREILAGSEGGGGWGDPTERGATPPPPNPPAEWRPPWKGRPRQRGSERGVLDRKGRSHLRADLDGEGRHQQDGESPIEG